MKGFTSILAIVVCLALFEMTLAKSSYGRTPAQNLRAKAMRQKNNRVAGQLNRQNDIARNQDRSPFPVTFRTTPAQQKAVEEAERGSLSLEDDTSTVFYVAMDFIVIFGVRYEIIDGKITYQGREFVVCGLTLALASRFLCCETAIVEKVTSVECCKNTFFYNDREICCGDYFYPKSVGGQQVSCCNDLLAFLFGVESCCDNEIVEAPQCPVPCQPGAGEVCCEGIVVPDITAIQCCPGHGPYLAISQRCCNNGLVIGTTC